MDKSVQGLLGPLSGLLGVWQGDRGMDVAPEPDGPDDNPYYETIEFKLVDDEVENAEEQNLVAVHYHQVVQRKSNDNVFHDQTGYWMWDAEKQVVMHSLVIPRGVGLIAGGKHDGSPNANGEIVLEVASGDKDPKWQIMQSPFMQKKAKTLSFEQRLTLKGDELSYHQNTVLEIYGKRFDHSDENTLKRIVK